MITLIHTSKTMRPAIEAYDCIYQAPQLINYAKKLHGIILKMGVTDIEKSMGISRKLAEKTKELNRLWTDTPNRQRPAIDSFLGDIYSGLQVAAWTNDDRSYANRHLRILSGLYGILKPLDSISPYRYEMGYKLPKEPFDLYKFWGNAIAETLEDESTILNLSAAEYTKALLPYLENATVVSPKFMTISPKTGEPTFVVVHAKIARGAFAAWVVKNKIEDIKALDRFSEIGYSYDKKLSTDQEPVFIAKEFRGLGLSVRLS